MNNTKLSLACVATSMICLASTPSKAEEIDLSTTYTVKGYSIGQEMTSCPKGTVNSIVKEAETRCKLGPTTYAGKPASRMSVSFFKGRVSMVFIQLEEKGQHSNATVRAAMESTYGAPSDSRPHINEYSWRKAGMTLVLDGWKGQIGAIDSYAYNTRVRDAAVAAKSDM